MEREIIQLWTPQCDAFEICSNLAIIITLPPLIEHSLLDWDKVRTNHISCHIGRSNTRRRVPMGFLSLTVLFFRRIKVQVGSYFVMR